MTFLGTVALWTALLVGLWGAVIAFSGRWQWQPALERSVTRSVYAVWFAVAVASFALWRGLFAHDFNIEYVWAYTARNLPDVFIVTAFWAGQKGSLLLWALILTLFGSLAQFLTPRRYAPLLPYVAGVTQAVAVFFIAVMLFAADPFERLAFTPLDGRGLNPQLQHPGMIIHPPLLYLGYISFTIPFAFAVAALLSRRLDTGWIFAIRRWSLVSWLFLAVGITLGMWWAYVELGWGGYWAWDPVENASLLPWLTMTAFLHSVMIQEKRGMLKRWNLTLVVATFLLTIFGTFLTRSGVIASVHSFTQSPVGWYFLAFLVIAGTFAYTLLHTRWPQLAPDAELESMLSREAAFLFNNLLLVGIAFSVLWGTMFPILSELLQGTKITVGPPFFNRVNVPLGLLLLGLTGIGPLIAWRRASRANLRRQFIMPLGVGLLTLVASLVAGIRDLYPVVTMSLAAFVGAAIVQEFSRGVRARMRIHGESASGALVRLVGRNRRRYGGYIVHVGILCYCVAFAGMAFRTDLEATLKPGESVTLASPFGHTWKFTHTGVSQYKAVNRYVSQAAVQLERDGKNMGLLTSEKRQHFTLEDGVEVKSFEPSTEVGLRSDLREDLYVVFTAAVDGTEEAQYRFTINPLVWWVWFGGLVLVVGGLITMWPGGGGPAAPNRKVMAAGAHLAGAHAVGEAADA